jgi:L-fucose mutarotase/ribose pyranase (RbsD/FucU family)
MKSNFVGISALAAIAMLFGISSGCQNPAPVDWRQTVADRARLYGHRNWIVIADSAYPAQSRDGIETIVTGEDQLTVVKAVLQTLDGMSHVKPVVYTDAELAAVPEGDAPGVTEYRHQLADLLGKRAVSVIPHEEVIAKLDQAGATFRVLILKSNLTIPYTSVFLQLECGYWTPDAEARLRAALKTSAAK